LLPVIAEVPLGAGEDFRWSPSVGANLQSLASLLEWLRGRRVTLKVPPARFRPIGRRKPQCPYFRLFES